MNSIKVKDKKQTVVTVALTIILNIFFYILTIFLSLFIVSFDWSALLPNWRMWQNGMMITVPEGTPGAWFDLGILAISGIVNALGILLYLNTFFSKWLSLALEKIYIFYSDVIGRFKHLISNTEFRSHINKIDRNFKIETWKTYKGIELENLNKRMPESVRFEYYLIEDKQSKKTKKWKAKEALLKLQLTDKWIDENIYKVKIKYPRLTPSMVIHGVSNVYISRIAVEDTNAIIGIQITTKILFGLLTFAFVTVIAASRVPAFRADVWNMIKDIVVYSTAVVINIMMGLWSAEVAHKSRIKQTSDRIAFLRTFVGDEAIEKVEKEIKNNINLEKIKQLEDELKEIDKKS